MKVKFPIGKNWTEEERIAERAARVVVGVFEPDLFPVQDQLPGDTRWTLDGSNDWFLRIDSEARTATLKYRYGRGADAEAFMAALSLVLARIFR